MYKNRTERRTDAEPPAQTLQGGQTVADVAKAHNVDLQVVIAALVAVGQTELHAGR